MGSRRRLQSSWPLKLLDVIDSTGRTNYVRYTDSVNANQITEIEDPFGHKADFSYDIWYATGNLWSVANIAGLGTTFGYGLNNFVRFMTTPYGTNTFSYSEDTNSPIGW